MGEMFSRDKELQKRQDFKQLCEHASDGKDILKIAENYHISLQMTYNDYIGWALPTKKCCNYIFAFYKMVKQNQDSILLKSGQPATHKYPRIIDIGAGTGLFCSVLHYLGVPKECLVAFDKKMPSHRSEKSKQFWPILHDVDFDYDNDILLIAWGCPTQKMENIVDNFVLHGGKHVVLIGEQHPDMTFGWDYLSSCNETGIHTKNNIDVSRWSTQSIHINGPASFWSERVSINSCEIQFFDDCGESEWNDKTITDQRI
jgi:hypothetical protein